MIWWTVRDLVEWLVAEPWMGIPLAILLVLGYGVWQELRG